ncbi:class I SAM-dependent methyltransferase [Paenibacillus kobensis]|uniref:class I SAM-dependent methyltransferase n=1 Tax=Paenibacillus kobensis TaxID=59841 RepID=UPI000FD8CA24|nr:SAM-dependent methyltransferase [Paenibacillus kobensis]
MDRPSQELAVRIAEVIRKEGVPAMTMNGEVCRAIPFNRYMALCLYDEQSGYYRSGGVRIGREGDFYTSSAIGGVMGQMLAKYLRGASISCSEPPVMMEWAAGAGTMTRDMLAAWSDNAPEWMSRIEYWAVDDHPQHLESVRELAYTVLARSPGKRSIRCVNSAEAMEALAALPQEKTVLIAANELIDAMPVHRVTRLDGQLKELGVCIQPDDGDDDCSGIPGSLSFRYAYLPLSTPKLAWSIEADGVPLAEGQETEINLAAEQWLAELGAAVQSGMLLLADYGHDAQEYRAAHRMKGTLMCYRRHMAHDNPFLDPGEQDITAHVNFTALKRAAQQAGWSVAYEATQLQFLLEQGILELLEEHDGADPFSVKAKRNRAVRQVLLSDSMSETFKIMVLTRGGFTLPYERAAT